MHDAVRVIVGRKKSASSLIKQKLIFAGTEKGKLLALRQSFVESLNPPVLIFVQSKERAKQLYNEPTFDDVRADVIHADLTEEQSKQFTQSTIFLRYVLMRGHKNAREAVKHFGPAHGVPHSNIR